MAGAGAADADVNAAAAAAAAASTNVTAELDHLSASLTRTIASLQGLCEDASTRKEDAALAATVSNVVEGLLFIRVSVGGIRQLLSEGDSGAKSEEPAIDADATGQGAARGCPGFHSGLDACVTSCKTVMGKLDAVVACPDATGSEGWADDSDGRSLADSVAVHKSAGRPKEDDRQDVIKRVGAVVEPLHGAWEVLAAALRAYQPGRGLPNQQPVLESTSSRELFRRLEKSMSGLSTRDSEERRSPLGSLFRPLLGWMGGKRTHSEQHSKPAPQLTRTTTWPVLQRNPADSEMEEARKRSARIDKQIEADSFAHRNKCTIAFLSGSYESRFLLMDAFVTFSTSSSMSGASSEINLQNAVETIRSNIQSEAMYMVDVDCVSPAPSDSDVAVRTFLIEKYADGDATLDWEFAEAMERLWSSRNHRTACARQGKPDAYNEMVMDAVRRASTMKYVPTIADHRRFLTEGRRLSHFGTFHFAFEPISVDVLVPHNIQQTRIRRGLYEETTSIVYPIDLLEYNIHLPEETGPGPTKLKLNLLGFQGMVQGRYFKRFRPAVIPIFFNVNRFREELRVRPFAAEHADFAGQNNVKDAVHYVITKLLAFCDDRTRIYPHVGELTDEATVKYILAAVKETMLQRALRDTGLF